MSDRHRMLDAVAKNWGDINSKSTVFKNPSFQNFNPVIEDNYRQWKLENKSKYTQIGGLFILFLLIMFIGSFVLAAWFEWWYKLSVLVVSFWVMFLLFDNQMDNKFREEYKNL